MEDNTMRYLVECSICSKGKFVRAAEKLRDALSVAKRHTEKKGHTTIVITFQVVAVQTVIPAGEIATAWGPVLTE